MKTCSTKMPPSQNYKRRCVAWQQHHHHHPTPLSYPPPPPPPPMPDDQALRLQAGAGEDDFIHLPDRVACERQEEEGCGLKYNRRNLSTNPVYSVRHARSVPHTLVLSVNREFCATGGSTWRARIQDWLRFSEHFKTGIYTRY